MINMFQKPRITYAQLGNITDKSREAIRKNINSFKKAGLVKRICLDKVKNLFLRRTVVKSTREFNICKQQNILLYIHVTMN